MQSVAEKYTDKDGRKIYEWKCIIDGEWEGTTYLAPTREEAIRVMKQDHIEFWNGSTDPDRDKIIESIRNDTEKFDATLYIA